MISIIIPTYNREDLIQETLDSILAQTETNWECLLIDDGSTDQTWNVLQSYSSKDKRFKIFKRQDFNKPKGANACRNIGIEKSNGEYLIFFDSDDLMLPTLLETHLSIFQNNDIDLNIVQSEAFFADDRETFYLVVGDVQDPDLIRKFFKKEIAWITQNPMITKKFLNENSVFFDESLYAGQDWDFFMRLFLKNPIINFENEVLIKIRQHLASISHNKATKALKLYNYYKARHNIYHHYLDDVLQNRLKDYYINYVQSVLSKLINLQEFEFCKKIISRETRGINKMRNFLVLKFIQFFGKGISLLKL